MLYVNIPLYQKNILSYYGPCRDASTSACLSLSLYIIYHISLYHIIYQNHIISYHISHILHYIISYYALLELQTLWKQTNRIMNISNMDHCITESLVCRAHLLGKFQHLCREFLRRCGSKSLVLKVIDDGLKQEDK